MKIMLTTLSYSQQPLAAVASIIAMMMMVFLDYIVMKTARQTINGVEVISTRLHAALQITRHCRLMILCYAGTTSSGEIRSVIVTTLMDQSTGMVATAPAPATTVVTHGIMKMMESPGHG